MKSFLLIGTVLGMANACNKATPPTTGPAGSTTAGYQISGQLTNAPAGTKVYLAELGETQFVSRDTAAVDDKGQFRFTGSVPEAGLYQVKVNDQNQVLVALSNGSSLSLAGDAQKLAESYRVQGSPDSELWQRINQTMQRSQAQTQQAMPRLEQRFNRAVQAKQTDSIRAIQRQAETLQNQGQQQVRQLLRQTPASIVSAFVVTSVLNPEENFPLADSVATQLKASLPESRYTKALAARLEPMRATAVGVQAPEINLAAPDGKAVALSSLRGKYVLIDFWASWCGPCRKENPNVVKAYNRYKGKGFEIYGVSFDQDREKWLKAIKADGLTWKHVSDLRGWESAAGQTYSIKSIPASILLDPQGRIIGKNLRGEALEAKLASLLQ